MKLATMAKFLLMVGLAICLGPRSFAQAGQDMKDAGHDTKNAAVDTGHATKTATKKVYHKTAHGTHVAAHKTADGAKDVGHGTKVAAKDTAHGAENLGDKVAGKPESH